MSYLLDEIEGDIRYEVKGNKLILKVKPDVFPDSGTGGSSLNIDIIKTTDLIQPTDKNVFSSLRTLQEINEATDDLIVDFNQMFLRKDIPDIAHDIITFDKKIGSSIFLDGMDGKGWEIKATGAALLDSARVRSDIFLGGKFGSVSFASGWDGWGTEIDIPTSSATFDFLTVRKSMKVYELVYSQIYGLGGSVLISDLNKILYVETCQGFYRCHMDSMDGTMRMNLRKDDIVRMQRSQGINVRYFYGEILKVTSDYFDLKIIDGEDYPQLGDVVFRMGNKTDAKRQGVIYLTSNDDHAPYIDVLDGITDASMFEKVKVRVGNLRGIRTKKGIQLDKYGIYGCGAVFEDTDIYLQDGTTVEQQFIIMNGNFTSAIEGIRNDMSLETGNILRNSSFGRDTNYWSTSNTVHFINVGGDYLWMDGSFYAEKSNVADIYRDGSKNVLRIRNASISQMNSLLTGERTEGVYSIAFYYKVLRSGTLSVGFEGKDLYSSSQLTPTDSYQKFAKYGNWDGLGDFKIGFTGEILIYGVSLFNDRLADAQIKLQTQIDQQAEYIKLLATKDYVDGETGAIYIHYDSQLEITAEQMSGISTKVEGLITESSGWITRAEGTTLFAKKEMENGKSIVNAINVGTDGILIEGNRINLVGAVTFSAFNSSLQNTINGKANSSSLGSLAYKSSVSDNDLSFYLAQTIANKVDPGDLDNYAQKGSITKGDLISSLQSEINGAMQKETYIIGGYIKTSLIDVDKLYATSLAAVRGTIGGFTVSQQSLTNTDGKAFLSINNGSSNDEIRLSGSNSGYTAALNITCNQRAIGAAISCAYGSNGSALSLHGISGTRALYSTGGCYFNPSGATVEFDLTTSGSSIYLKNVPQDNNISNKFSGRLGIAYVDGRKLVVLA
ncbi:hypothetical protein [Parabacteroides provencensis]|uniref:hypothetical protein n=1 Tax=Parabacteroides provencensis TaxID=1944636 RepID=UPI000C150D99|nr:hypothetical protein [Parabacteroides provencensis]